MDDLAVVCVKCGVPKGVGNRYCVECGFPLQPLDDTCKSCGWPVKSYYERSSGPSGFAIASLTVGIIAILVACLSTIIGIIGGIVAIVLGKVDQSNGNYDSKMNAIGIILGIVAIVLAFLHMGLLYLMF